MKKEELTSYAGVARANINITGVTPFISPSGELMTYVNFEFQWRDPRNHCARWFKTVHVFRGERYTSESVLFSELRTVVRQIRTVLEEQYYDER